MTTVEMWGGFLAGIFFTLLVEIFGLVLVLLVPELVNLLKRHFYWKLVMLVLMIVFIVASTVVVVLKNQREEQTDSKLQNCINKYNWDHQPMNVNKARVCCEMLKGTYIDGFDYSGGCIYSIDWS